jgi:hypothetical protein
MELILLLAALFAAQMQVDNRFHYYEYGIMYLMFLAVNLGRVVTDQKI